MKNALDYIYETGCRNIDAAIDRAVNKLEPIDDADMAKAANVSTVQCNIFGSTRSERERRAYANASTGQFNGFGGVNIGNSFTHY